MEEKSINLVAKPMFTNPSSTPVITVTQMMKSLWRNAVGLRWVNKLYIYSINNNLIGDQAYYPGRFFGFSCFNCWFLSFFFFFWTVLVDSSCRKLRTLSGKGQGGEASEEAKEQRANGRAAQTEISANWRTRYFSQRHDTVSLTWFWQTPTHRLKLNKTVYYNNILRLKKSQ